MNSNTSYKMIADGKLNIRFLKTGQESLFSFLII